MPRTLPIEAPVGSGLTAVDGRIFPLTGARLSARAGGAMAESVLRQIYRNPYAEPLEVIYTLPLPADGAVTLYSIRFGETRIKGEIEVREKAQAAYRKALEEGRSAAILEQERADTFTQKLGSIPAGAGVEVEITVLHPLLFQPASGDRPGEWEYRFPTVAGIRYEGAPGRVPDRDNLEVARADEAGTPVRLELELAIEGGDPATMRPRSSSHTIVAEGGGQEDAGGPGKRRRAAGAAASSKVRLAEPSRLDRDVSVSWTATTDDVQPRLTIGSGLPGDTGRYGLLTITPPARPAAPFARDVTVLIDASGSMAGLPLDTAKELTRRLLQSLVCGDRFEILAFSMDVERVVPGPAEVTPQSVSKAIEAVDRLSAGGGTEMASALTQALRPLRPDSQRQVILLTDGFIGFESEVIGNVLRDLPAGARVHAAGIGSAPNRTLTRGIARAGRGVEIFLFGAESIEAGAARLLAATVAPVLTDLEIQGSALIAYAPERPADLYSGRPATISLELRPEGGTVEIRGRLGTGPWTREILVPPVSDRARRGSAEPAGSEPRPSADAVVAVATRLPLGAKFGREAIEDQEMRLAAAAHGEATSILGRIETLGLRHRIPSRRTSLVAVAEEPSVDPRAPRRRRRLEVEMPAEVSAEGVGLGPAMFTAARSVCVGLVQNLEVAHRAMHLPMRTGREAAPPPREIQIHAQSFIHAEVVVEFESPCDGFELPEPRALNVMGHDGRVQADIDFAASTRPGTYPQGVTLRLVLRRAGGRRTWQPGHYTILLPQGDRMCAVHFRID
jgi:Ca-activated chloride channel family protein